MTKWALEDAKARFSEVVQASLDSGPQEVTRHGRSAVVIVAAEEWARLTRPRVSLGEFLRTAPRVELDTARDQSPPRDDDLDIFV